MLRPSQSRSPCVARASRLSAAATAFREASLSTPEHGGGRPWRSGSMACTRDILLPEREEADKGGQWSLPAVRAPGGG